MKKKIIIALILLAGLGVGGANYFKTSEKKDKDLKTLLREAGFANIPSLTAFDVSKEKRYWWNTYQVYFISYSEMDSLCLLNNFIVGEASRYKEEIPEAATKEMLANYEKLKEEIVDYGFRTNGQLIAPPDMYLSRNEVGWWIRDESNVRRYDFIARELNLENRLTDKGVNVMRNVYYKTTVEDWEMERVPELSKILVVGDARKFNTEGMVIQDHMLIFPPQPDPIAVLKHRKGYIILSKW